MPSNQRTQGLQGHHLPSPGQQQPYNSKLEALLHKDPDSLRFAGNATVGLQRPTTSHQ